LLTNLVGLLRLVLLFFTLIFSFQFTAGFTEMDSVTILARPQWFDFDRSEQRLRDAYARKFAFKKFPVRVYGSSSRFRK
jgi:hypothetical protein